MNSLIITALTVGGATILGGAVGLVFKRTTKIFVDGVLSFAAGVMLAAAFIGLIAAFVARALAGKGDAAVTGDGAGVLSLAALIFSVILMLILSKLAALPKLKWLESFAMPMAMIGAMGLVMLLAQVLPSDIAFLEWRG